MKRKQNIRIREYAKEKKVYLWEIAMKIGIADANFSRKLRKELSEEETSKIINFIDQISRERGEDFETD